MSGRGPWVAGRAVPPPTPGGVGGAPTYAFGNGGTPSAPGLPDSPPLRRTAPGALEPLPGDAQRHRGPWDLIMRGSRGRGVQGRPRSGPATRPDALRGSASQAARR
ncbi:hypothetical protein B7R87_07255 [Streptomyces tsukubensis]|nr:hypothetical protein B7R87_07255 [Streptomyces tsukubensis]